MIIIKLNLIIFNKNKIINKTKDNRTYVKSNSNSNSFDNVNKEIKIKDILLNNIA